MRLVVAVGGASGSPYAKRLPDRPGIPNELMRRWTGVSPHGCGEPTEE